MQHHLPLGVDEGLTGTARTWTICRDWYEMYWCVICMILRYAWFPLWALCERKLQNKPCDSCNLKGVKFITPSPCGSIHPDLLRSGSQTNPWPSTLVSHTNTLLCHHSFSFVCSWLGLPTLWEAIRQLYPSGWSHILLPNFNPCFTTVPQSSILPSMPWGTHYFHSFIITSCRLVTPESAFPSIHLIVLWHLCHQNLRINYNCHWICLIPI